MPGSNLSWLNLFVSDMQTGFGPFVPVRLAASGWDPAMIGKALSVGTIAAVLAQVPAGIICDATTAKRGLAAAAIVATMLAVLLVGGVPLPVPVFLAEALQGVAGVVLTLAIAGITLSLTQHDKLGERLGNNLRFASLGGAVGAGLLGLAGSRISHDSVFLLAAGFGLPALFFLARIRAVDVLQAETRTSHLGALPPARRGKVQTKRQLLSDSRLLALMACVLLFHLSNAAMLPLAAGSLARNHGPSADLVVSWAIIIPQLLTAAASPWVGRRANLHGRRPLLLLGFAMLPVRALLFAIDGSPVMTLLAQVLDGVTSATFGVLVPLVVADITHRGGRFNMALGMVGLATSVGATVSNYAAGSIASATGTPMAFVYLAAIGLCATAVLGLILPETRHAPGEIAPGA